MNDIADCVSIESIASRPDRSPALLIRLRRRRRRLAPPQSASRFSRPLEGQARPGPTTIGSNSGKMNTYAKRAANPCRMRTSKIIGLKVPCNEHLQKSGGREALFLASGDLAFTNEIGSADRLACGSESPR